MNHCKTDDQLSDFDTNALETCKNMSTDEAYRKAVAACSTRPQSATESFLEKAKAAHDRMSQDENYRQQVAARATTTQN
jgi:hypothetical protein